MSTATAERPQTTTAQQTGPRIEVLGEAFDRSGEILTPEALQFLTDLHHRFAGVRHDRLADRQRRRYEIGNGRDPKFREDTRSIRDDASWRVAGPGPGLEDRRVEITGPTDPKMTINALNSGARVWLADQEDATSPTWRNVIGGQLSLFDAIRGQLSYTSPEGKQYEVTAERTPTIVMRRSRVIASSSRSQAASMPPSRSGEASAARRCSTSRGSRMPRCAYTRRRTGCRPAGQAPIDSIAARRRIAIGLTR